jgi:hypothetical protein
MSRNFRSGAVGFEHREFNWPAPCQVVRVELDCKTRLRHCAGKSV